MSSFAIVVICYEKLFSVKRLLKSLEIVDFNGRKDITIIFSIDFSSENIELCDFIDDYQWNFGEKVVRKFNKNQGLKKHVLSCGDLTNDFDILVVLEDDLFVSNSMYHFASKAASFYHDDDNVAGISLYSFQKNWLNPMLHFHPLKGKYDTYFLKVAQSWGQVWTKNKWSSFRHWYELNTEFIKSDKLPESLNLWNSDSSWLMYHDRYCIDQNKYFVYPYFAMSTNFSDPGTHSKHINNDSQSILCINKSDFEFPKLDDLSIKYDEFMESENLEKYLQLPSKTLCVDLNSNRSQFQDKRYLLTTRKFNYKIIREFSLRLKPVELNIINNIEGKGIYLYDTTLYQKNNGSDYTFELLKYSLGISSFKRFKNLLKFSCEGYLRILVYKLKKSIRK